MDESQVITARGNESVFNGLEYLISNGITSVPVYDIREDRYNAFLSYLDICVHTLKVFNDCKIDASDKFNAWKAATCSQVSNMSKSCSYQYLSKNDNLLTATLKMVSLSNIRRLPVTNFHDELVGILSQSHIIKILADKIDTFPCAKLTIDDISLGTMRKLKSVTLTSLVKDVFSQLVENRIYGIPVVDDNNEVVGNVSASDIQIIASSGDFSKFEVSVKTILPETHQRRSPITIKSTQTIAEAFKIMSKESIHRLFVVDNTGLIGLISPVDLIQAVLDRL